MGPGERLRTTSRPLRVIAFASCRISRSLVRMVCDAVHLQKIHAPARVLTEERVVPRLPGLVVLDPPAGGVPRARVGLVRRVLGPETRPFDWSILLDAHAWDAADDVNPELEPLRMHPSSELRESRVLAVFHRGREARRHRDEPAVLVDLVRQRLRPGSVLRIDHVPAFVDDGVRVPGRLQPGGKRLDVVPELPLVDPQPVRVPAVPAHGRRGREELRARRARLLHG